MLTASDLRLLADQLEAGRPSPLAQELAAVVRAYLREEMAPLVDRIDRLERFAGETQKQIILLASAQRQMEADLLTGRPGKASTDTRLSDLGIT